MNGLKDYSFQQLWPNKLYWHRLLEGKATPRPLQMEKPLCLPKARCRAARALFGCLPASEFNNLAYNFTARVPRISKQHEFFVHMLVPGVEGAGDGRDRQAGQGGTCTPSSEARRLICKRSLDLDLTQGKRHEEKDSGLAPAGGGTSGWGVGMGGT